jgi:Holliday junction DNA helicase RuvB
MKSTGILSTKIESADEATVEQSLRPSSLNEYIGQEKVKRHLELAATAARGRQQSLDHVLLYGPPGLGKTTLAHILGNEMGSRVRVTAGPALSRAGDVASLLTALEPGDILFIDEIHRINRQVEEVLYPAMEDYALDIILGKGVGAQSVRLDVPHFTLVGATTRIGMLSGPLRDRFGHIHRLDFYEPTELRRIVQRSAGVINVSITDEAAELLGSRSRGTPRIANRLLKRVRDVAEVERHELVTPDIVEQVLTMFEVDPAGLDANDRRYLQTLATSFDGGPAGLETLAAALAEDSGTLEEVIEPYLLQQGFIARTPRGRVVTSQGFKHLGLTPKQPTLV